MRRTNWSSAVVRRLQRGAVAVEFALVSALFLMTLLVGIIELGRVFFYMSAAAQATRLGARMAVVCDMWSPGIKDRMQAYLGILEPEDINVPKIEVVYSPQGCTAEGPTVCQFVTVRIVPDRTKFHTLIPYVPLEWTVPPFSTTLPRESMSSENDTNPVCKPPWRDPSWISL